MKTWYYYLHTNGDLIPKPPLAVESDSSYFDSPFVKKFWKIDLEDRYSAWKLVLEALTLGADLERVKELVDKWNLTLEDSVEMLKRSEEIQPTQEMKNGLEIFAEKILNISIDDYWKKAEENFCGEDLSFSEACGRKICCCKCIHSSEGVCDIAGEVGCGEYAEKCSDFEKEQ